MKKLKKKFKIWLLWKLYGKELESAIAVKDEIITQGDGKNAGIHIGINIVLTRLGIF